MKNKLILTGVISLLLLPQMMVAHAELVVIANTHASFSSLTQGELRRIFLGQTGKFPNGERAEPLDVSGDFRNTFYEFILNKSSAQVENYWTSMIFTGKAMPPRQIQPQVVKQAVASSPRAISYMDRSQVDSSVKIISIVSGK